MAHRRFPSFSATLIRWSNPRSPETKMQLLLTCILFVSLSHVAGAVLLPSNSTTLLSASLSPHPDPEAVVLHLRRRVEEASLAAAGGSPCLTGNPIDDCWRCDPNWEKNRQRLADCGIGFGGAAGGGKGGEFYVVTDSSDGDPADPKPGTLRHAVIQEEPLWIVFSSSMMIRLKEELIVGSFKTIDGRGANVHITGGGCITLQRVSNVIIHNIHIHHCVPSGEAMVRSSPAHAGWRSRSDGDGISIYGSRKIWVDHCSLSHCTDGLIDAIMGSTGITISNSYFSHHDEVMLLGHSDDYSPDAAMQVTIAFNHFGEALVQRMPRCRLGYVHVVNNDFTQWEMYAIGGSANPTIISQGNRYTAPADPNAKEVTKRVETEESVWEGWNWRTEGDVMVNGAFFVPSGEGLWVKYAEESSVEPKSAAMINQLTMNAGVIGGAGPRGSGEYAAGSSSAGDGGGGGAGGGGGEPYDGYFGMIFGGGAGVGGAAAPHTVSPPFSLFLAIVLFSLVFMQPE